MRSLPAGVLALPEGPSAGCAGEEGGDAIAGYVRWRNARATPKRNFAPRSVIWTWTSYQNKVA